MNGYGLGPGIVPQSQTSICFWTTFTAALAVKFSDFMVDGRKVLSSGHGLRSGVP